MRQVISTVLALAYASAGCAAEPPAVAALQEQIRTTIDAAEPSVAAIVVSSNPAYPPLTAAEKAKPGVLGPYRSPGRRSDGIAPAERDKLDLADPRNAADNTFGSGLVLTQDGRVLGAAQHRAPPRPDRRQRGKPPGRAPSVQQPAANRRPPQPRRQRGRFVESRRRSHRPVERDRRGGRQRGQRRLCLADGLHLS